MDRSRLVGARGENLYAMGAVFPGAIRSVVSFYLTSFMLDSGISAGTVGVALFLARVIDSVSDPIAGSISDNSTTEMGRRKTWMLVSIPLAAASFLVLWLPFPITSGVAVCLWYVVAYCGMGFFESMFSVNHDSVVAEMVDESDQLRVVFKRTMVFVLSTAVSSICVSFYFENLSQKSELSYGYMSAASILMLVAAPFAALSAYQLPRTLDSPTIFDNPEWTYSTLDAALSTPQGVHGAGLRLPRVFGIRAAQFLLRRMQQDYRTILGDREFMMLCVINMCVFVVVSVIQPDISIYVRYVLRQPEAAKTTSLAVVQSGVVVGLLSTAGADYRGWIEDRCRFLFHLICGLMAVSASLVFLDLTWLHEFLFGAGISSAGLIIQSLLSSVVSRTTPAFDRKRLIGTYYGCFAIFHDISSGAAIGISNLILYVCGYRSGEEDAQPGSAVTALRLIFALLPLISLSCALLPLREFARLHNT
jgi:glycoside/pentoside/hexuronide:cation symporter, GPH family